MSIELRIESAEVKALIRQYPKLVNQELNRALDGSLKSLGRKFSRGPLSRSGTFRVRRSGTPRTPRPPKVKLAKKATMAGFTGKLFGKEKIKGKEAEFGTRNPLVLGREFGRRISPGKKGYLTVGASQWFRRKRTRRSMVRRVTRPIYIPARLGGRALMRRHETENAQRLNKGIDRAIQRGERARLKQFERDKKVILQFGQNAIRRIVS